MSTVELNGVTVYVSAIESVETALTADYQIRVDTRERQIAHNAQFPDFQVLVYSEPKRSDFEHVLVTLTSGREFRIVGKTRGEVEQDILLAKRRDRS